MAVGAESCLGDAAVLPPTARRPFTTSFAVDPKPGAVQDPFEENSPDRSAGDALRERQAAQQPQIPPCVRFNSSVEERRFEQQSPEGSMISSRQTAAARLGEWQEGTTPEGEQFFFNTGTKEMLWERPAEMSSGAGAGKTIARRKVDSFCSPGQVHGHSTDVAGSAVGSRTAGHGSPSPSSSSSSVPIRLGEEVSVYSNSSRMWCHGYVEQVEEAHRELNVKVAFQLPGADRDQWHKKELPIGHQDLSFLDPKTEVAVRAAAAELRGAGDLPMPVSPKALNVMFQDTSLPKNFTDEEKEHYDREFDILFKASFDQGNHSPSSSSSCAAALAATSTLSSSSTCASTAPTATAATTTAAKAAGTATTTTATNTSTNTATSTAAAASGATLAVPSTTSTTSSFRPPARAVESDLVAEHLKRCGLPRKALKELWQVSNPDLKALVGPEEFRTCCRLVGHCQSLLQAMLQDSVRSGQQEELSLTPQEIRELFKRGGGPLREVLRRGDRIGAPPSLLPRFDVLPSPSPTSDSRSTTNSTPGA